MVNNGDVLNFSSAVSANAHEINSIIFDPITFSGGDSGLIMIDPGFYNPGVLYNYAFVATFDPPVLATLTAVPVPAALWLFSSALLGLVGLGRPRKAVMG
jgi:hypothetical protein